MINLAQNFPKIPQHKALTFVHNINIYQLQERWYEEFLPTVMEPQISIGPFHPSIHP